WMPKVGIKSMTEADAATIQATELGHATKDLYESIERGDHPEWELLVQVMSDEEHPELDFDPLDDTKVWPENEFPPQLVGRMVLNRNVTDHHNENEQISFGTGVLVDGLDFSDDKMLVGRTFSYSDTQRYRVGSNYLQLPVNRPVAPVRTNQEGGVMSLGYDERGANPSVNYEPSYTAGLSEADESYGSYEPVVETTRVTRAPIDRTNNYGQAGNHYRNILEDWERDDLVLNLVTGLSQCTEDLQAKMLEHFTKVDEELGKRVSDGLRIKMSEAQSQPMSEQRV
ncbi:MAG TPA: catalase, partial [Thermomicrobiales bacterium]|nr:catalase [Thermomicrobiales bacterium]